MSDVVGWIGEFIADIFNFLILGVATVLGWIAELFPDSPFKEPIKPPDDVNLSWLTWVLDFPTWIQHFALITSAILIYYSIRVLARWIKLVRE